MTQLNSITTNHLALQCRLCGHSAEIAVEDLIARMGSEVSAHYVARNARCSRCHVKGQTSFRIVYVGGSGEAMQGARQDYSE